MLLISSVMVISMVAGVQPVAKLSAQPSGGLCMALLVRELKLERAPSQAACRSRALLPDVTS